MPENIPQITSEEIASLSTVQEVGFAVLRKWIAMEEISDNNLKRIIAKSLTFPIPITSVGNYAILELFHGPTMAFKDIAAGVLAQLFEYYLKQEKRTVTILVATSGDTGGAIAQAFSGLEKVNVVILYPSGKVSELQEKQLTRVEKNILSIAVEGDFDACQAFVKRAFQDKDLLPLHLSTANSINIGRLLPQIIYYAWAYRQLQHPNLQFVIPSGNMGNATAALLAKKMGLPIDSLIIATNENDVAVEYYKTGIYQSKKTQQTLSTAMDIGNPSNFERILDLVHHDYEAFRQVITAIKISDAQTVATMKKVYKKNKYLLDFHTAVGFCAAERFTKSDIQTVVVSTAAPEKFAKEIVETTGIVVDNSQSLATLRKKEKHVLHAKNDYVVIKKLLLNHSL